MKRERVLRFLVLGALMSVALWDSSKIIRDYLVDNKLTLVRRFTANDSIPFLKNISALLCLDYGNKSMFRDIWINKTAYIDKLSTFDAVGAMERLHGVLDERVNYTLSTVDDRLSLAALFSQAQVLDLMAIRCIILGQECGYFDMFSFMDYFLRNNGTVRLESLEEAMWRGIRPTIINNKKFRPEDAVVQEYSLWLPTPHMVCVDFPLYEILNCANTKIEYLVGHIVGPEAADHPQIAPTINIFAESFTSGTITTRPPAITEVVFSVTNLGVFDKRLTTTCSDEPTVNLWTNIALDDCANRQYFEILSQICRCMPITYRKQVSKVQQIAQLFQGLPFCTSEAYASCVDSAMATFKNRPACKPACSSIKNDYSISRLIVDLDQNMCATDVEGNPVESVCSHSGVVFEIKDLSYIVFEERYQMNPSQLLSQFGGVVGIYTGLSLASLWTVIVHVYNFYHKKKKRLQRRLSTLREERLARLRRGGIQIPQFEKHQQEQQLQQQREDSSIWGHLSECCRRMWTGERRGSRSDIPERAV